MQGEENEDEDYLAAIPIEENTSVSFRKRISCHVSVSLIQSNTLYIGMYYLWCILRYVTS